MHATLYLLRTPSFLDTKIFVGVEPTVRFRLHQTDRVMRASIKESSVQACQLVDTNDQLLCCPTIIASFTTAHNLVLATPSQSYVHV